MYASSPTECPSIEKSLDIFKEYHFVLTDDLIRLIASFADVRSQTVAMFAGRLDLDSPSDSWQRCTLEELGYGREVIDDIACLRRPDDEAFEAHIERIIRTNSETAKRVKRQMLRLEMNPFVTHIQQGHDHVRLLSALRDGFKPVPELTDEQRARIAEAVVRLDASLAPNPDGA